MSEIFSLTQIDIYKQTQRASNRQHCSSNSSVRRKIQKENPNFRENFLILELVNLETQRMHYYDSDKAGEHVMERETIETFFSSLSLFL